MAEPIELLTGGEGAKAKEPEAWEAKGDEAEPSALSAVPRAVGGEEGEVRGSGARDDEEGARGEGREAIGADHERGSSGSGSAQRRASESCSSS
jgi:hypothetical protein